MVTLNGSEGDQVVGGNYRLICNITGGVTTTSTHRWFRNGSLLHETSGTLSFLPLNKSDSGVYICEGTRSSITRRSTNFTITVAGEFQKRIIT